MARIGSRVGDDVATSRLELPPGARGAGTRAAVGIRRRDAGGHRARHRQARGAHHDRAGRGAGQPARASRRVALAVDHGDRHRRHLHRGGVHAVGIRGRLRPGDDCLRRVGMATGHQAGGGDSPGPLPRHAEGAVTQRLRSVMDLRALPDVVFGPRDLMWWGTLGFVLIEGFTLVLCAAAYLYITQNFPTWPPQNTPLPSLVAPSVQVLVMLVSLWPAHWTAQAARRYDIGKVRIGLIIATAFAIAIVGLRIWELLVSLGVKWDANAYGSVQWLVVGAHATLLFVELVEVGGMMLIFWLAPIEEKHMSDVADMVFYWYFIVLSWLPLYVLCFWLPRWL